MIKLDLIGNLGFDCRVSTMNDGKTVLNFSVALNNGKDGNGNQRPVVWVNCSLWYDKGKEAKLEPYLLKGTKVYVSGYPSTKAYQDQAGKTVSTLNLFVNQIELLSGKPEDKEGQPND